MSSQSTENNADTVRQSLTVLSDIVRQMTAAGAKPVPANPSNFNLLARPVFNGCRICGLPGHASANIKSSAACRTALLSLIGFWEDATPHVTLLYQHSERFQKAIVNSQPTYEMRLDDGGLKGGATEDVLVERLTRNWLKFVAHFTRIRAKANVIFGEGEIARYEGLVRTLNGFFLDGLTCKFDLVWQVGLRLTWCSVGSVRAQRCWTPVNDWLERHRELKRQVVLPPFRLTEEAKQLREE